MPLIKYEREPEDGAVVGEVAYSVPLAQVLSIKKPGEGFTDITAGSGVIGVEPVGEDNAKATVGDATIETFPDETLFAIGRIDPDGTFDVYARLQLRATKKAGKKR